VRKVVTIRDILNKLKWTNRLHECELVYISRGEPNNEKVIDLSTIVEVCRNGFTYVENGREKYIPYHRVIEIRTKDGREVFIKRKVPH